jgi:hypothetical protein
MCTMHVAKRQRQAGLGLWQGGMKLPSQSFVLFPYCGSAGRPSTRAPTLVLASRCNYRPGREMPAAVRYSCVCCGQRNKVMDVPIVEGGGVCQVSCSAAVRHSLGWRGLGCSISGSSSNTPSRGVGQCRPSNHQVTGRTERRAAQITNS